MAIFISDEPESPIMTQTAAPPPPNRARAWSRGVLMGPVSFIAAALVMVGSALWLPKGPAGIDNLVWPIVLFPLLWTAMFLYSCLDVRLGRAWLVVLGLALSHGALIANSMMSTPA
ncbi:MAG: hypothetical protein VX836_02550 [Pseudomonadota bacterium]|nr:hypothetical protein [Pseudomonadota bacterium]